MFQTKPSNLTDGKFIDTNHVFFVKSVEGVTKAWERFGASRSFQATCEHFLDNLRRHFAYEEDVLQTAGYGAVKSHARDHAQLLASLEALLQGGLNATRGARFVETVQEKIFEHELVSDQDYWSLFENRDFTQGRGVQWAGYMETGVASIDAHHKSLAQYINRLAARIDEGTQSDLVLSELEQLYVYSVHHFDEEEDELQRISESPFERHKTAHKKLLQRLQATKSDVEQGDIDLRAVPNRLGPWLTKHITGFDVAAFHSHE